jgi:hypothetical protein
VGSFESELVEHENLDNQLLQEQLKLSEQLVQPGAISARHEFSSCHRRDHMIRKKVSIATLLVSDSAIRFFEPLSNFRNQKWGHSSP